MITNPKLSICVPIYGVEPYIERCATSLLTQFYPNVEYIFVNDQTKDASITILEKVICQYPDKSNCIRVVNHDRNLGLAGARLTGLNEAKGEYVWFVDSDDYIEPDAISQLEKYMNGENDIISFSYFREEKSKKTPVRMREVTIERLLRTQVEASVWKSIFKKSLFFNYGIMPIVGVNYGEDFLLTPKLALVAKKNIVLPDLYLYNYNCENENSYVHRRDVRMFEQGADAAMSVCDFYKKQGAASRYSSNLGAMVALRYFALADIDEKNERLAKLADSLRQICLPFYIILKMNIPLAIKKHLSRACKIILAGRDANC